MTGSITSDSNKSFRRLKSLLKTQGIKKHGQFLVSGHKVILELFESESYEIIELVACPVHLKRHDDLLELGPSIKMLETSLYKELDVFKTRRPLALLRTPEIKTWDRADPNNCEVICSLGDPKNLGALIRNCDAFGVEKIILTEESAFPFHPKSVRASSGSFTRVEFQSGPALKDIEKPVIGLDLNGQTLTSYDWPKNCFLAIGEEGPGLPNLLNVERISIPTSPRVDSLNASVALGIALYDYRIDHPKFQNNKL